MQSKITNIRYDIAKKSAISLGLLFLSLSNPAKAIDTNTASSVATCLPPLVN